MNKITEYISDNNYKIQIYKEYIYIYNYNKIISFSSNNIEININNTIYKFSGINLYIKKLTNDEILLSGNFKNIKVGN